MTRLQLVVAGEQAEAAAGALEQALGDGIAVACSRPAQLPDIERRAIDPIALAALILSIPSAVLAVADLADRIAKRRRAQQLIETSERVRIEMNVEVYVVTLEGPRPLGDLSADDLLELAQAADTPTA